ncbi:MAG TPA: energy transducer TonB [Pyrinomonadaceae bacterium]|nr:energy transducer TonB [Pyrinomonadaceae bacterium]
MSVAVLDMGTTATAARASEHVVKLLAESSAGLRLALLDRGMARAAARGAAYAGSLNMTLAEARSLGASIGCDFYVTGDAQTIRRSSTARPVYFESYASIFVVSSRTGRLVLWDRPAAESETAERAESALLASLDSRAGQRYASALSAAFEREERERFDTPDAEEHGAVIDLSNDEGADALKDLREPAPYRRLRPAYTDAAFKAEAEATVDASVEIDSGGEVREVSIVRWAGFGLDEEVASTVRRMHFRPAEREGEPVAVRVLLRYNFRRPAKTERAVKEK